ncbi:MAG: universal stress protein [Candidatus Eremiobacteraeota bacterium]|nr:universal stress protein [Candidatus Eremiobacteraeota bacterium]
MTEAQPHVVGVLLAFLVLVAISSTLWWMLHPPTTSAERVARATERDVAEIIGSVIIVFSQEVHSEHMMSLAVRLARRERARLLAAYIIEVPHTLPLDAEMESEYREALGVLQVADSIARKYSVEVATEITPARNVAQGVLELAKRKDAHLIVLGSYREGKYSGAPMGRAIEVIAAQATCDVLIGIQGNRGKILTPPTVEPRSKTKTAGPPTG